MRFFCKYNINNIKKIKTIVFRKFLLISKLCNFIRNLYSVFTFLTNLKLYEKDQT